MPFDHLPGEDDAILQSTPNLASPAITGKGFVGAGKTSESLAFSLVLKRYSEATLINVFDDNKLIDAYNQTTTTTTTTTREGNKGRQQGKATRDSQFVLTAFLSCRNSFLYKEQAKTDVHNYTAKLVVRPKRNQI
eukprot:jgi/Psemu1/34569/gm1.34569_g